MHHMGFEPMRLSPLALKASQLTALAMMLQYIVL